MTPRRSFLDQVTDAAATNTSGSGNDAVVGAGLAVITVGIVLAVLLAVGFAILVRRNRRTRRRPRADDTDVRAGVALVRLDDQVAAAADELGFAEAQFGGDRAEPLAAALAGARTSLTAAFRLRQKLDDAVPDSATARREWTARILMLCETASERLDQELSVLRGVRALERTAGADVAELRRRLAGLRSRADDAPALIAQLREEYASGALAPVVEHPAAIDRLLASADRSLLDASGRLDEEGVGDASALVQSAERDLRECERLLDGIDAHRAALAAASARLVRLVESTRSSIADARLQRDSPPDPSTGRTIGEAISYVERALAAVATDGTRDPDAAISRLETSGDALDTALAGARSQQQRLSHARAALEGALLTARSQLESTRAHIRSRSGGVGAEARTRLAEAERLLELAEAESDPIIALDTARSSATYSRDADALARYDLLH